VGAIFDFSAEHAMRNLTLPPSESQRIAHLVFECSPDAPQGGSTLVELRNGVGPIQSFNVFAIERDGFANGILPVLKSSTTSIVNGTPPQAFLRGDIDANGRVDLSDAIGILGYLFLGGTVPRCMDAVDVDDSGGVNLADAISLLSYLFLGGAPPTVPFPSLGLDPTDDQLPPCHS
jgi:hypothetical protein